MLLNRTSRLLFTGRPTGRALQCQLPVGLTAGTRKVSESVPIGGIHSSSATANVSVDSPDLPQGSGRWRLMGATLITRPPVTCQPMTPIEKEYSEMVAKMEKELSLKSDHELRHEQDIIRAELLKANDAEEVDIEDAPLQTAIEYEDACVEELKAMSFGSTLTEADKSGALDTLDRALDRSLVLLVNQKLGDKHQWILPQGQWMPSETIRQTCERVVKEKCGSDLKVKMLGNAPFGFYKYKFPKRLRESGYVGAKVFIYKCQVAGFSGVVQNGSDVSEHQWLTLDELDNKLSGAYAKAVAECIVPDQ